MTALVQYIQHVLKESDKEFDDDRYVKIYGEFLEALGVKANQPLFDFLIKHMSQMKDARGAGRVEPPPPI